MSSDDHREMLMRKAYLIGSHPPNRTVEILSVKKRIWPSPYRWKARVRLLDTNEEVSVNIMIDNDDDVEDIVRTIRYQLGKKIKPGKGQRERQLKGLEGRNISLGDC